MRIRVDAPSGMQPRLDADKLPANAAQNAVDCNFNSGTVVGVRNHVTHTAYTHTAPPRGGLYVNTPTASKLFTFSYDVNGAASPIGDDRHGRFYWTGKNGSATEFKFGLLSENSPATSVGPVVTSYKVGVISSDKWDNKASSLGISFKTKPKEPPINLADVTTVDVAGYIVDREGAPIRRLTLPGDIAVWTGNGTPVRGWHTSYTATLSQDINAFGQATVPTGGSAGTYTKASATIYSDEFGTAAYQATLWTLGGETKFIQLAIGTTLPAGTLITVYSSTPGFEVEYRTYLGAFYVTANPSVLSSVSGTALPAELQPTVGSVTGPETLYFGFHFVFKYNDQTYELRLFENKELSWRVDIGTGITGSVVRVSNTVFNVNLEFTSDEPVERRAYIFTILNRLGEESEPSIPEEISLNPGKETLSVELNDTTFLAALNTTGLLTGRYPGHGIRVYRTATSSTGDTDFLYAFTIKSTVEEDLPGEYYPSVTVSGPSRIVDDLVPNAGLGSACSTQGYIGDSEELQGLQNLIAIHGGMFAASKGVDVWVCEPGKPWAWKPVNIHPLPHEVVDLVPLEQGFIALTKGAPWYFSGATPEQMGPQKIPSEFPCINKRASAVVGNAVVYISPDGPVFLSGMQAQLDPSFSRESWRDNYDAYATGNKMQLATYGHRVIAYYPGAANGWMFDMEDKAWTRLTTRIDYATQIPSGALGYARDNLMFADTSNNWKLFGNDSTTSLWKWHSKNFETPYPVCFGALMVFGAGTATVKVYADGVLAHTTGTLTLSSAGVTARLPSGFRATKWSFLVEAQSSETQMKCLDVAEGISEFKAAA